MRAWRLRSCRLPWARSRSFIESARSVRDLWSGSMILSWLTFQAMLPVVEQLGPTAVIYPLLRVFRCWTSGCMKRRRLAPK